MSMLFSIVVKYVGSVVSLCGWRRYFGLIRLGEILRKTLNDPKTEDWDSAAFWS